MERNCLGVVAAMPQEIAPLLRRLTGYRRETFGGFHLYRCVLQGIPVVLVESGMGQKHAAAATKALISHAAPSLIVNFGFAGAVQPGLGVGEMVIAERVLLLEQGRLARATQPDQRLFDQVLEACAAAALTLHRGTFITAAGIMNKKEVAGLLPSGMPHPVLEMETAAVLLEAGQSGIPVVAIRGISDAAEDELGFSLEEFCDVQLRISPARVLRCIAAKPWIIPQLVKLSGSSKKAGKKLALYAELALKTLGTERRD